MTLHFLATELTMIEKKYIIIKNEDFKMKKVLLLCVICLLAFLVSGCGNKTATTNNNVQSLNKSKEIHTTPMTSEEFIRIASTGTPKEVEAAIKQFKDINKTFTENTNYGSKELHIMHYVAQKTKYPEVIDILARNGADLNIKSVDIGTYQGKEIDMGMNPINFATMYNPNVGIVTALYNNGAKAVDGDYKSVFMDAINNQNPSILEEILKIDEIRNYVLNSSLNPSIIKLLKYEETKPSNSVMAVPNSSEKLRILYKYGFSD